MSEYAWCAGFFDGEGSTVLHPKGIVEISVPQVDVRPLLRFQQALGGGIRPERSSGTGGLINRLSVRGRPGFVALERMWPFLCQPKREQANRALDRLCSLERLVNRPAACWDDEPAARDRCSRGHSMADAYDGHHGRDCASCILLRRSYHKAGRDLPPAPRWYRNRAWWTPGQPAPETAPYWLPHLVAEEIAA